jgi:hypothetical protein
MEQMNADSTIPARTTHAEKLEKNRELHPSIDQSIDHVSFPMTDRLAMGQRRKADRRRHWNKNVVMEKKKPLEGVLSLVFGHFK